jgi:hypothetical protein
MVRRFAELGLLNVLDERLAVTSRRQNNRVNDEEIVVEDGDLRTADMVSSVGVRRAIDLLALRSLGHLNLRSLRGLPDEVVVVACGIRVLVADLARQ